MLFKISQIYPLQNAFKNNPNLKRLYLRDNPIANQIQLHNI